MTDYFPTNKYLVGDVEEEFERAATNFIKASPAERIAFMQSYDAALEDSLASKTYASRDDAQLLTHHRILRDWHAALVRAGR